MIIRAGSLSPVLETDGGDSRLRATRIGDAGGLRQFGAHLHTLLPGWKASSRHWHEAEDEFLFVVSGEVTVVDTKGEHVLLPGDSACWPAGNADAHQVMNRSEGTCQYIMVGRGVEADVVHYPELGQTLFIEGPRWRIEGENGEIIKAGIERGPSHEPE